ncbi:2294_t:CDS:2 [Entrophospora sp. SA101]|nr:2294_t:CDS:2 [Entrophospora sp. SA101]
MIRDSAVFMIFVRHPRGRSNDNRRHSNVNQDIGRASTAETNTQNSEPRASTENNPDNDNGTNNEINATGNSDSMSIGN